ncbi:MAG: hypothetical protein IPN53_24025 [Comamonadaceae bacterium]|nr:hypothetical protein [Comamonadaceae bacterium]
MSCCWSIWSTTTCLVMPRTGRHLAAKARKSGLSCTRTWAQGTAVLSVSDTGPGVSDDAMDTIFNAFVSRKEGGMGMGLAICRSIVEAHHGRIEAGATRC